tara:strand:- start:497 stop:1003 length:507 start_codon:yes stop_codon:yes gene_type:complete
MKALILFISFNLASINTLIHAQRVIDLEKQLRKKTLSISFAGTTSIIGFSYEQQIDKNKSLEIGLGLLGGGLGLNVYLPDHTNDKSFNLFWGLRSSYNIQGSGGSRIINYLPLGINNFGRNKFYLSIDLGPAHVIQFTQNGYVLPENRNPHPKQLFRIFGALKLGRTF